MEVRIESGWKEKLASEFSLPYFSELVSFVKQEYSTRTIYPSAKLIFSAFDNCPFDKTRVIILGQDPYHNVNQANGMCFSVQEGVEFPPSLQNIFKEIESDLNIPIPANGDLARWAKQGILLLNATLTVREHLAGSHQNKGWEKFTDKVISVLAEEKDHLVFLLWGSYAQQKGKFIDHSKHLVLSSPHPSPLSVYRGFSGNKHFSQTNEYLVKHNYLPIQW